MKIRIHLKNARKNFELKQREVAQYLNLSTRYYRAIETGTNGTSELNWLKLFNLFDCKVPLHKLMENTNELFKLGGENSSVNNQKKCTTNN